MLPRPFVPRLVRDHLVALGLAVHQHIEPQRIMRETSLLNLPGVNLL